MSKDTAQFANEQEVLLSVGPFNSLDTTTDPLYVQPNNAVTSSNVATNRVYQSFCSQQGRSANYIGTALAATPQAVGISAQPTTAAQMGVGLGIIPTILAAYGGNTVAVAGHGQPIATFTPPGTWPTTAKDSRWVFAGSYAFLDCGLLNSEPFWLLLDFNFSPIVLRNWGITGSSSAITTAAGAAGNLTGVYYWAVTFVGTAYSSNGTYPAESSPTPFSTALTLTAQQGSLSNIPVSSDPQVIARNIYRMGGTIGGTPLLVGTLNDNTTTVYTDNLADGSVVGQQMQLRQDPAPTNATNTYGQGGWQSIAYHKGRMWGFGTSKGGGFNKSDLWYSNYLQFTSFNSVTQVLDCQDNNDGDIGICIESLDSVLMCFKFKSTFILYGDTPNDFIVRKAFTVGCVQRGSVASSYGIVCWMSADGIQMFDSNAGQLTNISDGDPVKGGIRSAIQAILNTSASSTTTCRAVMVNRSYVLSIYDSSGTITPITYIYDITTGKWSTLPYGEYALAVNRFLIPANAGLTTLNTIGASLVLGASTTVTGQLNQWFAAETDLGSPVASTWTTGISDSGAPHEQKQYRYIELESTSATGATVMVSLTTNTGAESQVIGPFTFVLSASQSVYVQSLPPGTVGNNAFLTITCSSTAKTAIQKVGVYGYVKRQHSANN